MIYDPSMLVDGASDAAFGTDQGAADGVVAVAIVHFGDPAPTLQSLEALAADSSRVHRRVVVIDNSGDLEGLRFEKEVQLISRPENPGFGTAANIGLESADRDRNCSAYVVLNNDTLVDDGFLDAAAGAFSDGVGAAGGPIRGTGQEPRLWYAGGSLNFVTGTVRQDRSPAAARRQRDVGFIPGTALAVAPAAWHEVGGFDPRFFLYNEDVDLCLRLRRAGWRLRFVPGMACRHDLGGATGSAERSPLYLEHLSRTRLLPFRSKAYRLYLALIHSLYNTLRGGSLVLKHGRRSGPYVRALARGHLAALSGVFG
jgi:GT2 family glycosyltransferase